MHPDIQSIQNSSKWTDRVSLYTYLIDNNWDLSTFPAPQSHTDILHFVSKETLVPALDTSLRCILAYPHPLSHTLFPILSRHIAVSKIHCHLRSIFAKIYFQDTQSAICTTKLSPPQLSEYLLDVLNNLPESNNVPLTILDYTYMSITTTKNPRTALFLAHVLKDFYHKTFVETDFLFCFEKGSCVDVLCKVVCGVVPVLMCHANGDVRREGMDLGSLFYCVWGKWCGDVFCGFLERCGVAESKVEEMKRIRDFSDLEQNNNNDMSYDINNKNMSYDINNKNRINNDIRNDGSNNDNRNDGIYNVAIDGIYNNDDIDGINNDDIDGINNDRINNDSINNNINNNNIINNNSINNNSIIKNINDRNGNINNNRCNKRINIKEQILDHDISIDNPFNISLTPFLKKHTRSYITLHQFKKDAPPSLLLLLSSPKFQDRVEGFKSLQSLPYNIDSSFCDIIISHISDSNLQVSIFSIQTLLLLPQSKLTSSFIRHLFLLKCKDKKTRNIVMHVLYVHNITPQTLISSLSESKNDFVGSIKNPLVKVSVVEYVSKFDVDDKCVIEFVVGLVNDASEGVRKAVLACLGGWNVHLAGSRWFGCVDEKVVARIESYMDRNNMCKDDRDKQRNNLHESDKQRNNLNESYKQKNNLNESDKQRNNVDKQRNNLNESDKQGNNVDKQRDNLNESYKQRNNVYKQRDNVCNNANTINKQGNNTRINEGNKLRNNTRINKGNKQTDNDANTSNKQKDNIENTAPLNFLSADEIKKYMNENYQFINEKNTIKRSQLLDQETEKLKQDPHAIQITITHKETFFKSNQLLINLIIDLINQSTLKKEEITLISRHFIQKVTDTKLTSNIHELLTKLSQIEYQIIINIIKSYVVDKKKGGKAFVEGIKVMQKVARIDEVEWIGNVVVGIGGKEERDAVEMCIQSIKCENISQKDNNLKNGDYRKCDNDNVNCVNYNNNNDECDNYNNNNSECNNRRYGNDECDNRKYGNDDKIDTNTNTRKYEDAYKIDTNMNTRKYEDVYKIDSDNLNNATNGNKVGLPLKNIRLDKNKNPEKRKHDTLNHERSEKTRNITEENKVNKIMEIEEYIQGYKILKETDIKENKLHYLKYINKLVCKNKETPLDINFIKETCTILEFFLNSLEKKEILLRENEAYSLCSIIYQIKNNDSSDDKRKIEKVESMVELVYPKSKLKKVMENVIRNFIDKGKGCFFNHINIIDGRNKSNHLFFDKDNMVGDKSINNLRNDMIGDKSIINTKNDMVGSKSIIDTKNDMIGDKSIINTKNYSVRDKSIINTKNDMVGNKSIINTKNYSVRDKSIINTKNYSVRDKSIINTKNDMDGDNIIFNMNIANKDYLNKEFNTEENKNDEDLLNQSFTNLNINNSFDVSFNSNSPFTKKTKVMENNKKFSFLFDNINKFKFDDIQDNRNTNCKDNNHKESNCTDKEDFSFDVDKNALSIDYFMKNNRNISIHQNKKSENNVNLYRNIGGNVCSNVNDRSYIKNEYDCLNAKDINKDRRDIDEYKDIENANEDNDIYEYKDIVEGKYIKNNHGFKDINEDNEFKNIKEDYEFKNIKEDKGYKFKDIKEGRDADDNKDIELNYDNRNGKEYNDTNINHGKDKKIDFYGKINLDINNIQTKRNEILDKYRKDFESKSTFSLFSKIDMEKTFLTAINSNPITAKKGFDKILYALNNEGIKCVRFASKSIASIISLQLNTYNVSENKSIELLYLVVKVLNVLVGDNVFCNDLNESVIESFHGEILEIIENYVDTNNSGIKNNDELNSKSINNDIDNDGLKSKSINNIIENDGLKSKSINNIIDNNGLNSKGINNDIDNDGLNSKSINNDIDNDGLKSKSINNDIDNDGLNSKGINNDIDNDGLNSKGINNDIDNDELNRKSINNDDPIYNNEYKNYRNEFYNNTNNNEYKNCVKENNIINNNYISKNNDHLNNTKLYDDIINIAGDSLLKMANNIDPIKILNTYFSILIKNKTKINILSKLVYKHAKSLNKKLKIDKNEYNTQNINTNHRFEKGNINNICLTKKLLETINLLYINNANTFLTKKNNNLVAIKIIQMHLSEIFSVWGTQIFDMVEKNSLIGKIIDKMVRRMDDKRM